MIVKKLIVLFILSILLGNYVLAYDFSAVCSTGQTLYYNITSDTEPYTVEVTSEYTVNPYYTTYPEGDLEIPESVEYNGITYSVTNISYRAFYNCSGLTSLTIGNSVTNIDDYAFAGCEGLTSVTIPNSVTSIGISSFVDCYELTSVTIGNSVTSIGANAFNCCYVLRSVTIPNSVTSIGYRAFYRCFSLFSLTIPNSVTSIGDSAFYLVKNIEYNGTADDSYSTVVECDSVYTNHDGWGELTRNGYVDGYIVYSDSTKKHLSGCSVLATDITIPNSVTSIGNCSFLGCSSLSSVTIPESVTSVGKEAFVESGWYNNQSDGILYLDNWCLGYKGDTAGDITIADGTKGICVGAFEDCVSLTSVTIPNSVSIIDASAFSQCSELQSLTLGNSVTSIGRSAFERCSKLTSDIVLESETKIGAWAFSECHGLTSVTIGNSVVSIGCGAFNFVKNIIYDGTLTGSPWGALTVNGYVEDLLVYSDTTRTTMIGCSILATEVTIPNSVTNISDNAFQGCGELSSISIPSSVISIGDNVFEGCVELSSISIPSSVISIGQNNLYGSVWYNNQPDGILYLDNWCLGYKGVSPAGDLTIADGTKGIAGYAFITCTELTSVTIPNSVTSICHHSFAYCWNMTSVNIPDYVVNIEEGAFENCRGVTGTLTIPSTITVINKSVFSSCGGLTSVTIGNSVTSIGEDAFSGCSGLTSVTIGNSVTSIGNYAFSGCSGLTSVTIPNSVVSIGLGAFSGCSGLTSIYYTGDVAGWCRISFDGWYSNPLYDAHNLYINNSLVTELDIPESVTEIKANAFNGATCLTSLTIPNSVTSIGESAFEKCSGLTSVTIGNSVTSIGEDAFWYCSGLTTLTIPNSVTNIEFEAFGGCSGLTSLIIGNSVENIGDGAFYDCDSLAEIHIKASVPPVLGEEVFGYYDDDNDTTINNTTAILWTPCQTEDLYRNADGWNQFTNIRNDTASNIIVTAQSENEAMGNVTGGVIFSCEAEATLTAIPNQGYSFINWSNGSAENPLQIIVTEDTSYIAYFELCNNFFSIDTTVSNFVTIGDHTFYSTGHYSFEIQHETACDTIYDINLRVLAEPVYDIGPNPTSKMLNINSEGFISFVEFYSPTGQFVMRKEVNGNFAECDVESLVSGIYIVRIYGDESNLPSVCKIVKE